MINMRFLGISTKIQVAVLSVTLASVIDMKSGINVSGSKVYEV